MLRLLAVLLVATGCARSEGQPNPVRREGARERAVATGSRQKAPVTPDIADRAEKILAEHADDPVGTEIPFTLGGQRYVARVEVHDNPDAAPDRPVGEHKGITVYVDR